MKKKLILLEIYVFNKRDVLYILYFKVYDMRDRRLFKVYDT